MNHFSISKILRLSLCLCLSLGLVACTPGGTEKPAPSETQRPPQEAVTPPPSPVELTAEGELRSVNPEAMTFAIRDASGLDRTFSFTPTTRIIGAPSLQGLAGKQGSRAKVSYISQGDTNSATSIEISEASPAPGGQKQTPPAPGGQKK
jgi:hypothetical protein